MSKRKRRWITAAVAVAVAALIAVVVIQWQSVGSYAVIRVDGEVLARLPLTSEMEYAVRTEYGENIVVIEDRSVCVRTADCPEQICVHQGHIRHGGESIICLPHRLVVTVEETDDSGVDAVA